MFEAIRYFEKWIGDDWFGIAKINLAKWWDFFLEDIIFYTDNILRKW